MSVDLVIAMSIFAVGFFSIAFVSTRELRLARAYYYDAVAMSLVDGELEVLAAGEWISLPEGVSGYTTRARAFDALPPGRLLATRRPDMVRLEWIPDRGGNGRRIVREFNLREATP